MTMTEQQWLASTDPREMLRYLEGKVSERKLRLFACAWWRSIEPHDEEHEVVAVAMEQRQEYQDPDTDETIDAAWLLRDCMSHPRHGVRGANLLRDIVGNPFRELGLQWANGRLCQFLERQETPRKRRGSTLVAEKWRAVPWLTWQDGTIPRLAQAIYDERAFDRLPILADALEEARCTHEDVLQHCRGWERCLNCLAEPGIVIGSGPAECKVCRGTGWIALRGPHTRGCHVIDLLLGKS
jgi:hypothetical protein